MSGNNDVNVTADSSAPGASRARRRRRPSLRSNALSNWVALGVNVVIGFLLTPAIARHLGEQRFGMWMLVFSIVGYFGLLRLGIGAAVLRHVPAYRGQERWDKVSSTVSTAMALYLGVGLLILLASASLAGYICAFYGGTRELTGLIRLVGLAAALECPALIFDASIRGYEGFVYVNLIAIAAAVTKVVLLAACIILGYGLVAMGGALVLVNIVTLIGGWLVFRFYCVNASIHIRAVSVADLRVLFFYGLAVVLAAVADVLTYSTPKMIVGKVISLEAVGLFGLAALLTLYYRLAVYGLTRVFMPRFSYLWGRGARKEVRSLFLRGSRYASVFAGMIAMGIWVLGPCFVRLWMGETFTAAVGALMILTGGALVLLSHRTSVDLLYAIGEQNYIAAISLIEGLVVVALSVVLSIKYGLVGTAIAVSAPIIVVRACLQAKHVSTRIGISLWHYYGRCVLKPWILSVVLAAGAWATGLAGYADSWPSLVALSGLLVAVYAALTYLLIFEHEDRAEVRRAVLACVTRLRGKSTRIGESLNE